MKKELGQVFTPIYIVNKILDLINFFGPKILKQKILEPAAGDGVFLLEIFSRIVKEAKKTKISNNEIIEILDNNVYATELDFEHFQTLRRNIASFFINNNIDSSKFTYKNIRNKDSLFTDWKIKFDKVVGNPPYIRIQTLDSNYVEKLRRSFSTCKKGNIDIYFAFIEKSIKDLKDGGDLGLITPNSFFKAASAKILRKYISNHFLSNIINFESIKIFKNIMVYTSIFTIQKNTIQEKTGIHSFDVKNYKFNLIEKRKFVLSEDPWYFLTQKQQNFFEAVKKSETKISSIYNVQNGLATLSDKIYISSNFKKINKNFSLFNGHKIENKILKNIVKASETNSKNRKIIFPYKKNNQGNLIVIPTAEMKKTYPMTYKYFLTQKSTLLNRSIDKNYSEFYQFGRSQGLANMLKPKIILSSILKNEIKWKEINKNTIVYSGIYLTSQIQSKNNWNFLLQQFENKNFIMWLRLRGQDKSGGYKTISSNSIKEWGS